MNRPASGFVDLQINGLNGVDFNSDHVSDEAWQLALEALAADSTAMFLPTLITDSVERLCMKLRRLAVLCQRTPIDGTSVHAVGIHLEGPFLSGESGYIGAHPREHAQALELDPLKRLFDAAHGMLRLVTLAPERDPTGEGVAWLAKQGVLVAAGHCNPSIDQLKRSIDHGLTLVTHLGNACPPTLPRHDNVLHRFLSLRQELCVTMIADGHHLPLWLLDSWVEWFGEDRVAIVSDAISAAGLPAGVYQLGDRKVAVGEDGVPRSEDRSHFVGSGATLGKMRGLVSRLGWSEARIERLFRKNALRWLGIPKD